MGMPTWAVTEPYINLWLHDEPLGYDPGVGQRISFALYYKQREGLAGTNSSVFNCGQMWNFSWMSYISIPYYLSPTYDTQMIVAGGGKREYTNGEPEYYTSSILKLMGFFIPTGYSVEYPNGAVDYYNYGYFPEYSDPEEEEDFFLTAKADPEGHTTQFVYGVSNGCLLLTNVIDADGRTNTLGYGNTNFPAQITSVTDPFGRTCALSYDTNGMLTNVTDVAGMSSSFMYTNYTDETGDDMSGTSFYWVTNMTTPYGTTQFSFTDQGVFEGTPTNRSVMIVDPLDGTNLYLYSDGSSFVAGSYTPPELPANLPALDYSYMNYRNSWHWGPLQFASLSTSDMTSFNASDYLKGRQRHWMHNQQENGYVSDTLQMEQEPSPDGSTVGLQTWYEYPGQGSGGYDLYYNGTNAMPALIAYNLPDGNACYKWIQYDGWSHPTNVLETYSLGFGTPTLTRSNIYIYGTNGIDLAQQIGPMGETVAGNSYDNNHNLLTMTNAVGDVTTYTYDANSRLTSITSPAGLTTTNIYFSSGNFITNWVQQRIDLQIQRTNSYSYSNNLILSQTNELGLATSYTWDNLQRLTSTTFPDTTCISNIYVKLDMAKTTDRLGYSTGYGYDALRRLIAVTNALTNVTQYHYCSCGALESMQDALCNYTRYYYDIAGRLTNIAYPDGSSMTKYYNPLNQITNTVDGAGASMTNWYNDQGILYASSNAFGQLFSKEFDIEDRVTNSIDQNGVVLTNTYDYLARLLTRSYANGGVESFGYSAAGLIAYTNQLGYTTYYGYDAAMRKTVETNADNQVTQYAYDAASDLTSLTDAKTNITQWGCDIYGRVTNKVDATSTTILKYGYDADNRLTNRWSAQKGNTAYGYDAVGNLTSITYPVSPAIAFSYDAKNELTNMSDGSGTTSFTWTQTGQMASETGPWTTDTVSLEYNQGHRTSLSLTQPSAFPWTQTYGYDAAWRMTDITSPAGIFGYQYPALVNRYLVGGITLPNEASIINQYDALSRLTNTALLNYWGHPLDGYEYGLDLLGSRTNITRQLGLTTNSVAIGYDGIDEVTSWSGKESSGTLRHNEQLAYAYDAAGNLHTRTNDALIQTFNVDALNQLSNVTRTGPLTVTGATPVPASVTVNGAPAQTNGDFTFARTNYTLANGTNSLTNIAQNIYGFTVTNILTLSLPASVTLQSDTNGNLTNDGTRVFSYDDENQLTNVFATNAWRVGLVYDGLMRRRIQREYNWQSGNWVETNEIHYLCDGPLVLQERDTNNNPQVTYTRGLDLSLSRQGAGGIGGLLARTDGNGSSYYHADGSGNVTALIDGYQNIVARYRYDAYGKLLGRWGTLADTNHYRFSSMEFISNPGIYGYPRRFYEPNFQRWLNRDPIGEAGGINLYGFVGNNPINRMDPYGLAWYNPWSWGIWNSIANQVYPQSAIAPTPAPVNPLVDPDDAALDQALANGATPGSLYPGAGQQTVDALSQAGKDALSDAAQLAMMAGFPEGEGLEAAEEAAAAAKAASKCEKASEKAAKTMARQIGKDLGKDAQRAFHDAKEPGSGDRTMEQLKADAQALYEEYGIPVPKWMQ